MSDKMTISKAREIYRKTEFLTKISSFAEEYADEKAERRRAGGFIRGYESRDAEVNLLKSEVEKLKKELQKIVDLSDIVVCHPCFTVGTRAYSRLPKGLYPRIHDLNDAIQKYVLEESK